jgi:DNA helicase-2/ATP-dependent DNA helicase PcrA
MTSEVTNPAAQPPALDSATDHPIPTQENALLRRVLNHLEERRAAIPELQTYDNELISLRDQVSEARLEDVPALLAQMERVAGISAQRNELRAGLVDPHNPYFAHLALREHDKNGTREREVLIGRTTYIDSQANVRIVDWRHAPVSQIYYRYAEGDLYEERFGDREVEGELLTRRTVTIHKGNLLRIATPQGTFVRKEGEEYRLIPPRVADLAGGQGKATRPGESKSRGQLGVGPDGQQRVDRHLPEISALLDPRQFDLISRTDAGIVVIQGGAGSGKTTIGLHRLAFLNYQGPKKFAGERMMVVTTSKGLVSYTSEVLPALGVHKVQVSTFPTWSLRMRRLHFPWLASIPVTDDTPPSVIRLKKHPGILHALESRARVALEDPKMRMDPYGPVALWAELLTDLDAVRKAVATSDATAMPESEIRQAVRWCSDRCPLVADLRPGDPTPEPSQPSDDDDVRGDMGIDGLPTTEDHLTLDQEDDALLLRAHQLLRGPLHRGRDPIQFEHLFVDEAQDFAVAELAVLIEVTTSRRSITLAGDTSQRLVMDNHFRGWGPLFKDLGIEAIEIEPLKIAYRSTLEILELARDVLGPMAEALPSVASRTGAPVEMFVTPGPGVAVAQLGEALRALALREPRATVSVLARYSDQADVYYEGLRRAEVPNLHRVKEQDFRFRPGVDVTEIREVKGLEYDYVIVVDVNASTFPDDLESRHLLHVAATRAAHQLWLVSTGPESAILPKWLVDEAL